MPTKRRLKRQQRMIEEGVYSPPPEKLKEPLLPTWRWKLLVVGLVLVILFTMSLGGIYGLTHIGVQEKYRGLAVREALDTYMVLLLGDPHMVGWEVQETKEELRLVMEVTEDAPQDKVDDWEWRYNRWINRNVFWVDKKGVDIVVR